MCGAMPVMALVSINWQLFLPLVGRARYQIDSPCNNVIMIRMWGVGPCLHTPEILQDTSSHLYSLDAHTCIMVLPQIAYTLLVRYPDLFQAILVVLNILEPTNGMELWTTSCNTPCSQHGQRHTRYISIFPKYFRSALYYHGHMYE